MNNKKNPQKWRFLYMKEDGYVRTKETTSAIEAQEFDKMCRVNTWPFIVYSLEGYSDEPVRNKDLDFHKSKIEKALEEGRLLLEGEEQQ